MKKSSILFPVLAVVLIGITTLASAEDKPPNYVVLKGGIYSPSNSYDLNNYNGGSTTRLDSKTGGAGEIAVGHYLLPMFAVELGVGYFESKGSSAAQAGETKLQVVPVIATGKVLIPIGIFEPYGLFGIGAYFTKMDVEGNVYNFNSSSTITYGLHAGAWINFNLTENFFLGVEGKYLWAKPSYGGQDVNLDGFVTTADIGFRF